MMQPYNRHGRQARRTCARWALGDGRWAMGDGRWAPREIRRVDVRVGGCRTCSRMRAAFISFGGGTGTCGRSALLPFFDLLLFFLSFFSEASSTSTDWSSSGSGALPRRAASAAAASAASSSRLAAASARRRLTSSNRARFAAPSSFMPFAVCWASRSRSSCALISRFARPASSAIGASAQVRTRDGSRPGVRAERSEGAHQQAQRPSSHA